MNDTISSAMHIHSTASPSLSPLSGFREIRSFIWVIQSGKHRCRQKDGSWAQVLKRANEGGTQRQETVTPWQEEHLLLKRLAGSGKIFKDGQERLPGAMFYDAVADSASEGWLGSKEQTLVLKSGCFLEALKHTQQCPGLSEIGTSRHPYSFKPPPGDSTVPPELRSTGPSRQLGRLKSGSNNEGRGAGLQIPKRSPAKVSSGMHLL